MTHYYLHCDFVVPVFTPGKRDKISKIGILDLERYLCSGGAFTDGVVVFRRDDLF